MILVTFALAIQYPEAEAAPAIACKPSIDGETIEGGTIDGNIVVTGSNNNCFIENGATINGNIRIGKDAAFVCSKSTINGNILSRGAEETSLKNCTVTGKVSIVNVSISQVSYSKVEGSLTLRGNGNVDVKNSEILGKSNCERNDNINDVGNNIYSNNKGCPD